MLEKLRYKIKVKINTIYSNYKSNFIGNLIWKTSPNTFIYNPTIDFDVTPSNFDLKKLTSNKVKNVMIEVGTGNGDFLSYIGKKENRSIIIGFEIAKDYFIKTKNNICKNLRLNTKVAHADAYEIIKNKFQDESISKIFINFPDPWPKKKHWNRRFLTLEKLRIILTKLKKGGEIIFVTDHMGYADFVEENSKILKSENLINYTVKKDVPQDYPETKYFRKWKKLGKKDYKTITIVKR